MQSLLRLSRSSVLAASGLALPLAFFAGCGGSNSGTGGTGGTGGSGVTSVTHSSSSTSGVTTGSTTSATSSSTTAVTSGATTNVSSSATTTTTTTSATTTASQSSSSGGLMMENTNALCMDTLDNDGDNLVDCHDPDCKAPALTACKENCTNGTDDDGDGFIDCADSTCNGDNGGAVDAACTPTLIQSIQDGTVPTGSAVLVHKVFVTGVHVTGSGNVSIWVQEPQGVTTVTHTYPQFAGVSVFATSANAAMFPDFTGIAVGDCVSVGGTTAEFNTRTEIGTITLFQKAIGCGTAPTPYVVPNASTTFNDIATDTDLVTAADQPGAQTETFEGVLVTVNAVSAVAAPDGTGDFRAMPANGTANLLMDSFLYGSALPATAAESFTSITGVYDQFKVTTNVFNYRLMPRTAADLVQ